MGKDIIEKRRKPLVIAGIIIGSIVLLLAIYVIKGIVLTDTEKYVLANVERLQGMIKDPDSFKLRGDIAYIEADDDGEYNHYTFFNYSANNSYGASVQGTAMFKNHSYVGDYNDDVDGLDTLEEKLEMATTRVHLAKWNVLAVAGDPTNSSEWIDAEWISCKKIAMKLKIEYVE